MNKIELGNYRTMSGNTRSRVFTGRDRGENVRTASRIDELFSPEDMLEIVIPDDTFSITPSFLEEFLQNIVIRYGKETTRNHLCFKGRYKIETAFEEAMDRILQTKTALEI